jgi:Predicted redox protein, regulator of disulfide bond formation
MAIHHYKLKITWTGNRGEGTTNYQSYDRNHSIQSAHKMAIPGSSDPAFRGDPGRYNPEELLVASLSTCHMLWFLHLCTTVGVVVTAYTDEATGVMEETASGAGRFTEVTLHPVITLKEASMIAKADALHAKANELCFIANSVNFPVRHQPTYKTT